MGEFSRHHIIITVMLLLNFILFNKLGRDVFKGKVEEFEFKKVFEKFNLNKLTEVEARIVTGNLILASLLIPKARTNYQIPRNETLLHVLNFIDIEGSSNLKILYLLLP